MRKRFAIALAAAALAVATFASSAQAAHPSQGDFGLHGFDVTFSEADGTMPMRAGSHPFAVTTSFAANVDGSGVVEGWFRNLFLQQVPGLLGDTTAYQPCTSLQFLESKPSGESGCPPQSAVGVTALLVKGGSLASTPLYTIEPPSGVLLRLGFNAVGGQIKLVVDVALSQTPPYNPVAFLRNISQAVEILDSTTQLWGDPSAPEHAALRGPCGEGPATLLPSGEVEFEGSGESCPVEPNAKPFLTLPTTCAEPLRSSYEAFSWEGPLFDDDGNLIDDGFDAGGILSHDEAGVPAPFGDCGGLSPFAPSISAKPTNRTAESPTGLDFSLQVDDEGLTSVGGRSQSAIRRAVVTLPEGMTANPSLAEGLAVCSEADLGRETLESAPGAGCPEASKIGTIEVESPLISESIKGALFQAEPYHNLAGDSLIAFYIVLKNPELGIIVEQPVKVVADPRTGQLQAITDEIPQLAFSEFRLKFREGGRSPLVSPATCGAHTVTALLTPWSGEAPVSSTSTFEIVAGQNGCPAGGIQPFEPGFDAGSKNNSAGAFSPFAMRLTRRDGDQDLTRFDATLPPGVLAKLAGVEKCADAKIALARAKSGLAERAEPSCPPNSRIGRVIGGAGVASQLTYVSGTAYLAGPFGGAPLSVVGVVPAVAGPFDVGTVVVREALSVNPVTGQAIADGGRSDPIPHILAGIPLRVREIQVDIDRPDFTINPTSCAPMATDASIWGGGSNVFSTLDDRPVAREARYQAADCARLGFRPRLGLRLKGGTARGRHPSLRAVLRPRPHDANLEGTVVRLPRSAFLDQAHIRTICTRVQFAADACPKAAIYGHVTAFTPLLDEPLRGPVYLRSSNHKLPDLVFDLHGLVDIESAARVDSIRGGIRVTFARIPDAPISRVVVNMEGGRKGLVVNSQNLCKGKNRAAVRLDAQSGKRLDLHPLLRAQCADGET
jgi:hypothetical protein